MSTVAFWWLFEQIFLSGDVELNPGPREGILQMQDRKLLKNILWEIRRKWFNLGDNLGIEIGTLEAIQKTHRDNVDDCFNALIIEWLRNSKPQASWSALVAALRLPSVGEAHLAEEIENDSHSCFNERVEQHQKMETSAANIREISQSFSHISLIEGLDKEQKSLLENRLRTETEDLIYNFVVICNKFFFSLEDRHASLERLRSTLSDLKLLKRCASYEDALKSVKNYDDVKRIVMDYSSFCDFRLLVCMIEIFGTDGDKQNLKRYEEKFEEYAKRRIYECPSAILSTTPPDHVHLCIKYESEFTEARLVDIKQFQSRLSVIMNIPSHMLRLASIKEGCIEVTLVLPGFIKKTILPLSAEQKSTLMEIGVSELSCENYQYKLMEPDGEVEEFEVEIYKSDENLGITIAGLVKTQDTREEMMGIYVTSVNPVGAAAIDGGINVGDRIVKVDGYSLRGLDNMEAATVLRNCGNPVRLVLCRERLPHESMDLIRGYMPRSEEDCNTLFSPDILQALSAVHLPNQNLSDLAIRKRHDKGRRLSELRREEHKSDKYHIHQQEEELLQKTNEHKERQRSHPTKQHRIREHTRWEYCLPANQYYDNHHEYQHHIPDSMQGSNFVPDSWESNVTMIDLLKWEGGLGFSILDHADPHTPGGRIILVHSLVPGGSAMRDGRLKVGDKLLSVNQVSLVDQSLQFAAQCLLAIQPGRIAIIVVCHSLSKLPGTRDSTIDQKPGGFVREKDTEKEEVLSVPPRWTMARRRSKREKRKSMRIIGAYSETGDSGVGSMSDLSPAVSAAEGLNIK